MSPTTYSEYDFEMKYFSDTFNLRAKCLSQPLLPPDPVLRGPVRRAYFLRIRTADDVLCVRNSLKFEMHVPGCIEIQMNRYLEKLNPHHYISPPQLPILPRNPVERLHVYVLCCALCRPSPPSRDDLHAALCVHGLLLVVSDEKCGR